MSLLFEIKKNTVYPRAEILLVSPFKEIWERDKDENKTTAIKELSYAEFITSEMSSNPFSGYIGKDRQNQVVSQVIKDDKWKPDSFVRRACAYLIDLQEEGSFTYSFYMSARIAAEKVRDFFTSFDINERNEKTNAPIFKAKEINDAVVNSEKTLETMSKLRQKVMDEVYESQRTKGKKVISEFQR